MMNASSKHLNDPIAEKKTYTGPSPPYNVVVTGASKGIGRALAEEFLRLGDNVVICSRTGEQISKTVEELGAKFGKGRVKGKTCNVAKPAEMRTLADFAKKELGRVDIWVNNAGTNAYKYGPLSEAKDDELIQIVETNVLGVMLGCREAIRVMKDQPTTGHVFAAYGASKRGLAQLGGSISAELKMLGIRNVALHNLSPGMVTTELLMSGADTSASKFFINCLAEPPEKVAQYLVPRVRQVPSEAMFNPFTGAMASVYIKFLTKPKAYSQILSRLLTGARKDLYVIED
ncbi:MAG: hypothetical protein WDW36_002274 [Sanguina aurantia]